MEPFSQTLRYGCATHQGNVRDHNEDNFAADADLGLWLVADGMGGHEKGEVASAIARDTVVDSIKNGVGLADAIQKAHHSILRSGKESGAPGMGTTIVAIKVKDTRYEIAWVGDSRAYLFDGKHLKQVSKDHSYVQMLIDNGSITESEASNHQKKNLIYQCLGSLDIKSLEVPVITGEFLKGQKLLLCSDGLNDEINDDDISNILAEEDDDQVIADKLVAAVLEREANDNVTVLLIAAPDDAPEYKRKPEAHTVATQVFDMNTSHRYSYRWLLTGGFLLLLLLSFWVYYYFDVINT